MVTTWEWLGLIVFILLMGLLFFATFGTNERCQESIEEYMARLMRSDKNGPYRDLHILS